MGVDEFLYKFRNDHDLYIGQLNPTEANRQNKRVQDRITGMTGIFKPTLNLRLKTFDVSAERRTASEYGEFIGYKLAEMAGIPACKVELAKVRYSSKYSKSGKTYLVPGAISYTKLDREKGETIIPAIEILGWYQEAHFQEVLKTLSQKNEDVKLANDNYRKISPAQNNNIELIIPAFEAYVMEKCGGTPEKAQEIRQSIIDMIMYDCKFANTDRNDENYGLALVTDEASIRLYPMYDNEYILGFSEPTSFIGAHSATSLQEHINGSNPNNGLKSRMGVTSTPTKLNFSSMYTYLFTAYTAEAKKAADKVLKVSRQDLKNLMENCEGLDEVHKQYALRIFRARDMELEYIMEEYLNEDGSLKESNLPGNKPYEVKKGAFKQPTSNKGKSGAKGKSERIIGE